MTDGETTNGSTTVTSATASFTTADLGATITGTGIPAGARIIAWNTSTSVSISANATATATGVSLSMTGCGDPTSTTRWAISESAFNDDGSLHWQQNPLQYLTNAGNVNYRSTYGYDALGRVTTIDTPDPANPGSGVVTARTCYTTRGETALQISPANAVTSFGYDANQKGVLVEVVDPNGNTYDPGAGGCASGPTAGANQKEGKTTFGYDARGNRTTRMTYDDDLAGTITETWAYDIADRPIGYSSGASSNPVMTSSIYTVNTNGRLVAKTTRSGEVTDSSRRQVVETYLPSGAVESTRADACSSTDCATTTRSITQSVAYDPLGRHKTVTSHDTASGSVDQSYGFEYNTAGNITKVTHPDDKTELIGWDLTNKAVSHTYPDGQWFMYRYDSGQRLEKVDSIVYGAPINLATFTNNANGQRTGEDLNSQNVGTRDYTIDPATAQMTLYVQNLANATNWTTPVTYDTTGRIASDCKPASGTTCQGSDIKTAYTYDDASQLTQAVVSNDTTTGNIVNWTYSYGNRGNRTQQGVTRNGSGTTNTYYRYDDNRQLCRTKTGAAPSSCTETTGGTVTGYGYDRAGRRTSVQGAIGYTQTTSYDPRGLRESTTTTPNGGSATSRWYGYDPLSQLNCDTTSPTGCQDDGPNTNNRWTYWATSGAGGAIPQPLHAYDGATTSYLYVYGDQRLTVWGFNIGNDYLHNTTQGFANGAAPTRYSPFGESLNGNPASGHLPSQHNYRSERYLDKTLYLRARNYDPTTGTFLTRDPLDGVNGSTTVANPYAYGYNDPLNKTDPTGLRATDPDFNSGGGGGGSGGGGGGCTGMTLCRAAGLGTSGIAAILQQSALGFTPDAFRDPCRSVHNIGGQPAPDQYGAVTGSELVNADIAGSDQVESGGCYALPSFANQNVGDQHWACARWPGECYSAQQSGDRATSLATQHYGDPAGAVGSTGKANAFQHIYLAASLTIKMGPDVAARWLTIHEWRVPHWLGQFNQMDRANNYYGIQFGMWILQQRPMGLFDVREWYVSAREDELEPLIRQFVDAGLACTINAEFSEKGQPRRAWISEQQWKRCGHA